MNVKTSKPVGSVTLVTTVEPTDAKDTLYGPSPPVTVKPQGSHVARSIVTLGVIARDVEGGVGRHDAYCPPVSIVKLAIRIKTMQDGKLTCHGKQCGVHSTCISVCICHAQ